MAVPKILCGKCGGRVEAGQASCPRCGEPVEMVSSGAAGSVRCPVCGVSNSSGSAVCSGCGARMGTGAAAGRRPRKERARRTDGKARGLEPWQIGSIVAVAALLVLLIYFQLPGGGGSTPPSTQAPQTMPGMVPQHVDLGPLQAAVATNPGDSQALLRLANAQHDHGMFLEAVATYGRYLALRPDDPDARVDMGICYFEQARSDTNRAPALFAAALKEMRTALDRNPAHQPAAFNLGVVTLAMGNLEESRTWFGKAAALDKSSELGKRAQRMLEQHSF